MGTSRRLEEKVAADCELGDAEGSEAEASGPSAGIFFINTLITWSAKELVSESDLISDIVGPK